MLEPWIETYTGKKVYFLNPSPDQIDIRDIAHSLSNQCRFSGHTKRFYSVAEHSVRVSEALRDNPILSLQGLLHDASEAYVLDVPSPVKQYLTNYKEIEHELMTVIMAKFGSFWPLHTQVKEADSMLLKNEARALLPSKGASWLHLFPTSHEYEEAPWCLEPKDAEEEFMLAFTWLCEVVHDGSIA